MVGTAVQYHRSTYKTLEFVNNSTAVRREGAEAVKDGHVIEKSVDQNEAEENQRPHAAHHRTTKTHCHLEEVPATTTKLILILFHSVGSGQVCPLSKYLGSVK